MATPSVYQRVGNAIVTASDYDSSVGKVYLRFNGTNQWLQTNSIDFTSTDKMFVSAGVRKLSDAAGGILSELSSVVTTNSGSFTVLAPRTTTAEYGVYWKGTQPVAVTSIYNDNFISPITNVVTALFDLSGSTPQSIASARIDGEISALTYDTANLGGGTFGNYPLYIGARGGSSLWFNGNLHQLVIVGKQASDAEIAATETFINQKTGAY